MHYDLRKAGYVIDPPKPTDQTHDHVESDDPHLDGGVILDPDHSH
jgi:hypothetical protein